MTGETAGRRIPGEATYSWTRTQRHTGVSAHHLLSATTVLAPPNPTSETRQRTGTGAGGRRPVSGGCMTPANTLDTITKWLAGYVVFPNSHCAPTRALWAAHTWVSPSFYTTPRIILSSPVPGSGKIRVLELLEGICHAPFMTVNSSTAALYRRIAQSSGDGKTPPTALYDEVDALFGKRSTPQSEEVRALLNAGYKAGGTVDRCEGGAASMKVIRFPVCVPAALAGLPGNMPATITARAITMEIKKTPPRGRSSHIANAMPAPKSPPPVTNWPHKWKIWLGIWPTPAPSCPMEWRIARPRCGEPLLAIADAAGGHWPNTARAACRAFVFTPERRPVSLGVELLHDIREVMDGRETISTNDLLAGLRSREESAWMDLDGGRGITARRMAQLLSG